MTLTSLRRLFVIVLAFASLSACKVIIELPAGGIVQSSSGNFDCRGKVSIEQFSFEPTTRSLHSGVSSLQPAHDDAFHCEFDVSDTSFDEVFTAIPDAGYKFSHWRKRDRGFFGDSTKNGVRLFTSFYEGNDVLLQLLASNEIFYMEPVFKRIGDQRHTFESWSKTHTTNLPGYSTSVTEKYDMTDYTTAGLPAPTDKYKIADYGFFRSTITGSHPAYEYEDTTPILSFMQHGRVLRADLNGDGWQDFYMVNTVGNNRYELNPNAMLFAFLNDGDGNFVLSNDLFPEGNPCIKGEDCDNDTESQGGVVVADFNGDGLDDIYQGTTLVLSDNGKFYDKGDTHLPIAELFEKCMPSQWASMCFLHDADVGDADGDGDIDIFLPISSAHVDNFPMPWAMLINDGTGKFTANQNFPTQAANVFATAATIGDFDGDGHGDVAVGWFRTDEAKANGFSENHDNSAGTVFWNDGNNDWRNRAWTELPDNYYGANGNANDIKAFDFNGDGLLDIILASTKHDPYYDGRAVQFFLNNGDETFSDVTSTVNPDTKYVNGLCPEKTGGFCFWNGDGHLEILDFDGDGDLDIVDTVFGTYALINEDGTFTIYDDFPIFDDFTAYYPVEIDNKYFYDFIASTMEYSDTESIQTFYQVLDPPLVKMMEEITNKPKAYVEGIFESKMLFSDLRQNQRSTSLFATDMETLGERVERFSKSYEDID